MLVLGLTPEIRRIKRGMRGFMTREARYVSQLATREIAQRTPVGRRVNPETGVDEGPSGRLRASWRPIAPARRGNTYTAGSRTSVSYAKDVEYDTKRHIIPLGGKEAGIILHFFSKGHEVFAPEVEHPGTRGKYMMLRGLNETERRYSSEAPRRLQAFLDGKDR